MGNQQRTFKFYRKNEQEVMKSLGLEPTLNSGSTWIEKEDGQNDFVICQLKSTDGQSIKVNQKDLRTLEYNSNVAKKLPMFAIQFINNGEVWLMMKPVDVSEIAKYIDTGRCEVEDVIVLDSTSEEKYNNTTIKSSKESRDSFYEEREKTWKKK